MPALNYAVRLRATYEALGSTCGDWAARCERMLCYEHPEDPNNLHCHFLLVGVYESTDTLKRDFRAHGLDLKGPGQVSFKTTYKLKACNTKVDITPQTWGKYITYMSKGIYDPKYNKGFDAPYIAECKAKWTNPVRQSREESLLAEFHEYVFEYKKKLNLTEDVLRVSEARVLAVKFAIVAYKGVINVGMRKDAKMLLDSYCYAHDMVTTTAIVLPFEQR